MKKVDEDGTQKQQIIVKFTTWRHRTQFYKKRKNLATAKVHLDLTKYKYNLLTIARNKVRGNELVDFVFADVNCALSIRLASGAFKFFKNEEQLDKILGEL